MQIRTRLATISAKLTRLLIKTSRKSRGETAPGLVALKIDKKYLQNTNHNIPNRIVISGTNGKTTTTRMLTTIAQQAKINFVNNRSGSNLLRGIAASSINIKPTTTHAFWEADEAALIEICNQVKPTHILLTNLFRDQLDRYGEIDTILKKWIKLLAKLPKLTLILNADDPSLVHLSHAINKHHVIFFSLKTKKTTKLADSADAIFCPKCHKELKYQRITFSHLGKYSCNCGFSHPKVEYLASTIRTQANKTSLTISHTNPISRQKTKIRIQYPLIGTYNAYNALAASTTALQLNISPETIKTALQSFKPAFGRQEIISVNKKNITTILVKNPTGFNQAINTLKSLNTKITLLISINDRHADGRDVSWLWDVDFELLIPKIKKLIITGDRALDMAIRMKYAGLKGTNVQIIQDKHKAIATLTKSRSKNLYMLPTYTSLWEIRGIITGKEAPIQ